MTATTPTGRPYDPTAGATGYGAQLLATLATAGFTVRPPGVYVHGRVQVADHDGFVTVSRYTDARRRLVDWSASFAPGTPPALVRTALRHAGVDLPPEALDADLDDTAAAAGTGGLRDWTVRHGDGSLFATDLPEPFARVALDRLAADGEPGVVAEHATTGDRLTPDFTLPGLAPTDAGAVR